jgi:hypothetical protein
VNWDVFLMPDMLNVATTLLAAAGAEEVAGAADGFGFAEAFGLAASPFLLAVFALAVTVAVTVTRTVGAAAGVVLPDDPAEPIAAPMMSAAMMATPVQIPRRLRPGRDCRPGEYWG